MPNLIEESIRTIDATIAYHKKKINELEDAKKKIMDEWEVNKYD